MTARSEQTGIRIRRYEPADAPSVRELLRSNLAAPAEADRTAQAWAWRHEQNPSGPSYIFLAETDDGRIAGLRAFMRWTFLWGGRSVDAVRAADTVTATEFRGEGLVDRITGPALEQMLQDNIRLMFGVAAGPGLTGVPFISERREARLRPMVKVVDRRRLAARLALRRLPGGGSQEGRSSTYPVGDADAPAAASVLRREGVGRLENLVAADLRQTGGLRTRRSLEYMEWRYGSHPSLQYRAVMSGDPRQPDGCMFFRMNLRFGLREIVIAESMLADPQDQGLILDLLERVRGAAQSDYLVAYGSTGTPYRDVLAVDGFRRIPFGTVTLAAIPLSGDLPEAPEAWSPSVGDLESL